MECVLLAVDIVPVDSEVFLLASCTLLGTKSVVSTTFVGQIGGIGVVTLGKAGHGSAIME